MWTPTKESFLKFWENAREIYGLFNGEMLVCAVYFEYLTETSINIHVSVIERIEPEKLVKFFSSLKRLKHSEGIAQMQGWILNKNRHLLKIAANADFKKTGLKMSYGKSRGKVLNWLEVRG